jgi:hypothetical protein
MSLIDFKEIPPANLSDGNQDAFELFARDFLDLLGYDVISEPNRGPDGGRDFAVLETRRGIGGVSNVKWLVSCKHFASTGRSVGLSDESDILERVSQHGCDCFIGVYSTIASAGLIQRLEGIVRSQKAFEFQLFDHEKLATRLLTSPELQVLIAKYFPNSFDANQLSNYGINLAMARFGKPIPLTFQDPTNDRILTTAEVINQFPEGNQYGFIPWSAEMFLFNNLLGITKLLRGNELVDPTATEKERLDRAMDFQLEHIRREMEAEELERRNAAKQTPINNPGNSET